MTKLTLKELPNTVVNVKTQEEYDELMRIYERAGWEWAGGWKPTKNSKQLWEAYKNKTCIGIQDKFIFYVKYYNTHDKKIISLSEFKKIQGIRGRGRPKKEEEPVFLNIPENYHKVYIPKGYKMLTNLNKPRKKKTEGTASTGIDEEYVTVATNPDKPKRKRLKITTDSVARITKTLEKGDREIKMVINTTDIDKTIKILTYKGEDFIFENDLTKETLDKWEEVISLISKAIEIAREDL